MIGTDRPACEFDMSCAYDDPEVTPPENGGDDDNGNGGDDGGADNGDALTCTPTAGYDATEAYSITFTGHPVEAYNGDYCGDALNVLNGVVPYRKDDGYAFYYFGVFG